MTRHADAVSPDTLARLEREQADAPTNGVPNLLSAIDNNVAGAITEKEREIADLVRRVRELQADVVRLKVHQMIGTEVE